MSHGPGDDLGPDALAEVLGERALRTFPAILSTEAEACAWARSGAPHGAVVAAGYQAAPRGRGGLPWDLPPGEGLAFSLVLRPGLETARQGWLYTLATLALSAALDGGPVVEWPDEVWRDQERAGAVGVQTEPGPEEIAWGVVTFLAAGVQPPRGPLLGRIVEELDARSDRDPEHVLDEHQRRLATLGRRVVARMAPGGPAATTFSGTAVRTKADGALVIETDEGPSVGVPPDQLSELEEPEKPGKPGADAVP